MTDIRVPLFFVVLVFSLIQTVEDLRTMKVTLWVQLVSIAVAFGLRMALDFRGCWEPLVAAIVFGAVYWLVRKLSGGKFGTADVLFGVFQGMCLELVALPVCLAVETGVGALVFAVAALLKRGRAPAKVPFIPVMAVGLAVSYFFYYLIF